MSIPWSYNYIIGIDGFNPDESPTTAHFWTANCPPRFVSLGAAVTKSAEHPPATGTHYCIHESFAIKALEGNLRKQIYEMFHEIQPLNYAAHNQMTGQSAGTMGMKGVFPGFWNDQYKRKEVCNYILF